MFPTQEDVDLSNKTTLWLFSAVQDVRYSISAAHVLLLYEWITKYVCRGSWTSVKVAYLLCRYYPLLYWPFFEWAFLGEHSVASCDNIVRPIHAFFMPMVTVLFMRAYAFSGRNVLVLILLSLCYGFLTGTHIWLFWVNVPTFLSDQGIRAHALKLGFGCFPDYRVRALGGRVGNEPQLAVVSMDLLSLIIVIFYCLRRPSRQTSLGRYFLRQGMCILLRVRCLTALN
ncbi:hypothetical protein FA15DRAFT_605385 [Coprinopsis marcescibilis]|uniref:Uncharacterized protein n=1 Tax=Coprinopsis marcescibilis TaxID=230819 RepID=A0A5C3KBA5_COPMA|nr:hypothetical protein FA15DRAFT_605385 [Coprinopsis marcescibilis]